MRRYSVTQSELLSGRRIDEFICTGHSTEEITAEQERSADFLQECIMLRDNVFSLQSYYTRTDIELIIQHLCRLDKFRSLYRVCYFSVCRYVCTMCTNTIITIIIVINVATLLTYLVLC